MKWKIALLLSAAIFFSLVLLPRETLPSKESESSHASSVDPVVRFVAAGTAGFSFMPESDNGGDISWSPAFGLGAELSLASAGLTPIFQAGYYIQNRHWFHSIPVDIGGRYVWKRKIISVYLSGGASLFLIDKKVEDLSGETTSDWEVNPLVYIDRGTRFMFKRHLGIDIRFEWRTYAMVNMIGLKIGLAI